MIYSLHQICASLKGRFSPSLFSPGRASDFKERGVKLWPSLGRAFACPSWDPKNVSFPLSDMTFNVLRHCIRKPSELTKMTPQTPPNPVPTLPQNNSKSKLYLQMPGSLKKRTPPTRKPQFSHFQISGNLEPYLILNAVLEPKNKIFEIKKLPRRNPNICQRLRLINQNRLHKFTLEWSGTGLASHCVHDRFWNPTWDFLGRRKDNACHRYEARRSAPTAPSNAL